MTHARVLWTCLILAWAAVGSAQDQAGERPVPFLDLRTRQPEYVGPVGEHATADQHDEIRIGYFGPDDPEDPLHGAPWRAAQRAIDDANRDGGFEGKPFRLLPAWSVDPWGTGIKQLTERVYRDRVWAVVGGVDGPTTHLAEQVVVKARLALVSPVSTDKTVNLTNVPWMFSLAPGDHLVSVVLAEAVVRRLTTGNLVLITATDHDSYLLMRDVRRALDAGKLAPRFQFEYAPQSQSLEPLIAASVAAEPECVLVIADAGTSAQLVTALRAAGFTGSIIGGPACGRALFVQRAGNVAGDLVIPDMFGALPVSGQVRDSGHDSQPNRDPFADLAGDYAAVHTYDAVRIVTRAIQQAGLNRAEIARAIRALSPTVGASGRIEWDGPGSNVRRPGLATIVDGHIVPLKD